jgi:hypothetical protein
MSALRALTALNVMLWITALCHIVAMFPAFNIVSETFWAKITDILISVTYIFAITLAFMEYFRTEYGIFSEHLWVFLPSPSPCCFFDFACRSLLTFPFQYASLLAVLHFNTP